MRRFSFLLTVALLLCTPSAFAGMVWSAVAVDPTLVPKLRQDEDLLEKTLDESSRERSVYLDKAWHGIHFLLTGSAGPTSTLSSKVIFGGESIGPEQGYGQAQVLSPSEVRAIAKLLETETPERLSNRYDPRALERAKVYPDVIWVREGPEALRYVLTYYKSLIKFYREAAERRDAVILVVR